MNEFAQDLVTSSEWLFWGPNAGARNQRTLLGLMRLVCVWLRTRAYEVQRPWKRDAQQAAWTEGL